MYKQSNAMKDFANETALCQQGFDDMIAYMYLKLSVEQIHIKVTFYFHKNRFVMYRLSCPPKGLCPCKGSRPGKSYSAQMFQSLEQMLGRFSILCIST